MQSESMQVHVMCKSVSVFLNTLVECYLYDSYFEKTPLSRIALSDPLKFKPRTSMYLGYKFGMILSPQHNIPPQPVHEFSKAASPFTLKEQHKLGTDFPSII